MSAKYITSLGDLNQFSKLIKGKTFNGFHYPRIAMIGRSNVGKSTLINALVKKKIADVSKQPGKTRKINFFNWEEECIIADMPGYGFAKRSKKEQYKWKNIIRFYLQNDKGLKVAVVLLDARHGPTALDLQAIRFLEDNKITFLPVLTKYDTLKTQKEKAQRNKEILIKFNFNKELIWISSHKNLGINHLKIQIKNICNLK